MMIGVVQQTLKGLNIQSQASAPVPSPVPSSDRRFRFLRRLTHMEYCLPPPPELILRRNLQPKLVVLTHRLAPQAFLTAPLLLVLLQNRPLQLPFCQVHWDCTEIRNEYRPLYPLSNLYRNTPIMTRLKLGRKTLNSRC